MNNRKAKRRIYALAMAYFACQSRRLGQEFAWDSVRPVGWEFGSPDYERLAQSAAHTEAFKKRPT